MGKGDDTRQAILDHAFALSTRVGLEGLSIGRLAQDLSLSKSGLFAHFQSKEALQLQVIDTAAARFTDAVIRPALKAPRGAPRVRALVDGWFAWGLGDAEHGGCFFMAAAAELDDRPGPVRDRLVQSQNDWLDVLGTSIRAAVSEGHFRADLDADQLAFELYSALLGLHHYARLLGAPDAASRAHRAVDHLFEAAAA
jgi:AcrR family transcriptional regulator